MELTSRSSVAPAFRSLVFLLAMGGAVANGTEASRADAHS